MPINTRLGVPYRQVGGLTLTCDLYWPKTVGPKPVVILVFDGGWRFNDISQAAAPAKQLCAEGFAAVAPHVRLAPTSHSPAPQDDVAWLINWLADNATAYNIDPRHMATMGGSGGGHVATYVGVSGLVRCVTQASGPMALDLMASDGLTDPNGLQACVDFVGVPLDQDPAAWQSASPQYQISQSSASIFTAHSVDDVIPIAQARRMHSALSAAGIENRLLEVPGTTHGWGLLTSASVWPEAVAWLRARL